MTKVIIFDFDGTIADTLPAIVMITNRLAPQFGYQTTTPEVLSRLKNLSPQEIIKSSGISWLKLPFLLKKVTKELAKEISNLSPIFGMKSALIELKKQGHILGIVTSNSTQNVNDFIRVNFEHNIFDYICAGIAVFRKNKTINQLINKHNFSHQDVIYVGDETRDIEAARKSKIKIISVSWGFNSSEILATKKPDFLINDPQELITIINQLSLQPQLT
ncbi:MAG TPA: HAD-IA family hydrolase [Allocoleopsis sp.]